MANPRKPNKKQHRQAQQHRQTRQGQQGAPARGQSSSQLAPRKKENTARKVFTVVICVVVALGLMLPITGIGVMSCSSSAIPEEATP
jgi:hypothetical protein